MTRSTDSRRARNSASFRIGARRRPASRPSRRRCFLASSRVDPRVFSESRLRGSRTLTTVFGGSSGESSSSGEVSERRRRRRRRRDVDPPPDESSSSASAESSSFASAESSSSSPSVLSSPAPDLRRRPRPPRRRRFRPLDSSPSSAPPSTEASPVDASSDSSPAPASSSADFLVAFLAAFLVDFLVDFLVAFFAVCSVASDASLAALSDDLSDELSDASSPVASLDFLVVFLVVFFVDFLIVFLAVFFAGSLSSPATDVASSPLRGSGGAVDRVARRRAGFLASSAGTAAAWNSGEAPVAGPEPLVADSFVDVSFLSTIGPFSFGAHLRVTDAGADPWQALSVRSGSRAVRCVDPPADRRVVSPYGPGRMGRPLCRSLRRVAPEPAGLPEGGRAAQGQQLAAARPVRRRVEPSP